MVTVVKSAGDDLRALGESVRRAREAAEMSKVDLQDKSGVHRMTITHLEAGELDVQVATLFRLADALKVPVTDFFRMERVLPPD